ncbi:MAG TPA: TIGR04283 family arsenosugar biosynthesis glycosyltransferase [Stellaceae bacterium]|nr:TIGR04283 family arsenosugar biosynthesis glycosyltransferase [Stellaceae bacterium]
MQPPLSIIIPALDAAASLPAMLAALAEGRACDLIGEVLVIDGGSRDATPRLAEAGGACVVEVARGRGNQLVAGAAAARGEWLLFLHADTRLGPGWADAVDAFIARPENARRAGYLRYRLDDPAAAARRLEAFVAWRCRVLALPYGDQGLLIARPFYDELGGFRPLPLMEDVEFARRIGRPRLAPIAADAITSAARYRRGGYVARPLRNLGCLTLYFLGLPPRVLVRLYG